MNISSFKTEVKYSLEISVTTQQLKDTFHETGTKLGYAEECAKRVFK
jgi:hypothetical protein